MMKEDPNWAKVVQAAYRSAQGVVQWKGDLPEDHEQKEKDPEYDLRKLTGLPDEAISNAVGFATRTDLMDQVGSGMNYELTKKGFNVAHERELNTQQQNLMRTQNDANSTLATFTVILGAAALIQASAAVFTAPWPANVVLGVVYVIILVTLWLARDQWLMMDQG